MQKIKFLVFAKIAKKVAKNLATLDKQITGNI